MPNVCPIGTEIQTLLFPPSRSAAEARSWAVAHGFSAPKVDTLTGRARIRQHSPKRFAPGSFRTIPLGSSGVQAVIGCPKREPWRSRGKGERVMASKKRGKKKSKKSLLRRYHEAQSTLGVILLKERLKKLHI